MGRPTSSRKERGRLFVLREGLCHLCGGRIDGTRERWEIEHVIPWALSFDNSDANLHLAHFKCHKTKTAGDAGDIARAKRREANHLGLKTKKPWNERFRKRMDGRVEDRKTGEVVR